MATTKKNVLVIEDEKPLYTALRLKLEHEGITVTVATDGQEALELLTKNDYDLVLMDLIMPNMDGFQTLEQLGKMGKSPKIYVMSNLSQPEDESRARELGAAKFFIKADTALTSIVEEIKKL